MEKKLNLINVGYKIKMLRTSLNLSQVELANLAQVSVYKIRGLENGTRPAFDIADLYGIAKTLNVEIEMLTNEEPLIFTVK